MKHVNLVVILAILDLPAHSALVGRLPATPDSLDFQAYYDTDLDITWLADANLAESNTFGLATRTSLGMHPSDSSGVDGLIVSGLLNWPAALFWIDAMNAANYLSVNGWRLPITPQPDPTCSSQSNITVPPQGSGSNCTGSEMGHLSNVEGVTLSTPGPFINIQINNYHAGTVYAANTDAAWGFEFTFSTQNLAPKSGFRRAWAVHDGDVFAPVPLPAAFWLFGTGFIGLIAVARRKKSS